MKKLNHLLLGVSIFALSTAASAVPITGEILFGGAAIVDFTANSVNVLDSDPGTAGQNVLVTTAPTGDFASFASLGDLAIYNDFSYDPLSVSPSNPLWSIGGLSFSLTNITSIQENAPTGLVLTGAGTVSATGFDDTTGVWSFSADISTGTGRFSFSSQTAPEPAIALLLGVGLAGFGVSRTLRKAV